MYGVVLWSDRNSGRALIWCEDHGSLAYFDGAAADVSPHGLDEGDLVSFTVKTDGQMRKVCDVKIVASEEFPFLAQGLRDASKNQEAAAMTPKPKRQAKIVPFQPGLRPACNETEPAFNPSRKQA